MSYRKYGLIHFHDGRSLAGKRRRQSRRKATDVMLEMIQTARHAGLSAKYVLFDSWFSSPKTIVALKRERRLGIHLVLMIQRPRHLDLTALSQCGSIVAFNLTNPEDIDYLMTNANFYGSHYKNLIRELKIGKYIIVSDYISKGISCKVDYADTY